MTIFDKYDQLDCPEYFGTQFSLGLMVIYIVILNILLVNLLVAIFSNTYSEVETESDKIWKFLQYSLIKEYFYRPFLSTPFTIVYHIYDFLFKIFRLIFGYKLKKSSYSFSKYKFFLINLKML